MFDFKRILSGRTGPGRTAPSHLLPVTATFVRAYHLVWFNRVRLARAGALPFLMLATASTLHLLIFAHIDPHAKIEDAKLWNARLLVYIVADIIGAWTLLSFNISWRRYLLLLSPDVEPFYFRKPLWRYVTAITVSLMGLLVGFGILSAILNHLFSLADPGWRAGAPTHHGLVAVYMALMAAGLFGLFGLILLHYPLFTRVITDAPVYTFSDIRAAMRGSVLRLIAIMMLTFWTVTAGVQIIVAVMGLFHPDMANPVTAVVNGVLFSFLWVTLTALFSAVAGLVYDFTLHGHGPAAPANG